ncbi:type I restriction endonuclease [Acinetobacter vivianii]|uniref:type I restriction endonuclease n=1 Tax=Acinetobacter vivianii TaxID=1776742 RepID=UPI003D04C719
MFFLRLVLRANNSDFTVYSERQIRPKKNSIRPDISVWNGDKVIAILECKTQLGWDRTNWETNFTERERKLREEFPEASAYLLVMTGDNWSGFGSSKYVGQKYFCLLRDIWPVDYNSADQILTPIESLFSILLNH